jgi:mannose-6-phosphate isomerase-like protein (cupin superfamily)
MDLRPDGDSKVVCINNYPFPASVLRPLPDKIRGEIHRKGWGYEEWIWNSPAFCQKLLFFDPDKRCSYHYHKIKYEVFRVLAGSFIMVYGWLDDIEQARRVSFEVGDVLEIPVGMRHQMIAGPEGGILMEVSTQHFEEDSIRVIKGD